MDLQSNLSVVADSDCCFVPDVHELNVPATPDDSSDDGLEHGESTGNIVCSDGMRRHLEEQCAQNVLDSCDAISLLREMVRLKEENAQLKSQLDMERQRCHRHQ